MRETPLVSSYPFNFLLSSDEGQVVEHTRVHWFKTKILKSLLDIAILNEMTHRNAISVPCIIEFFVKKYAIYISSGTAYPIFERLEKQGCIAKLPNRLTRLYSITTADKNMLENVQQNIDKLEHFSFSR